MPALDKTVLVIQVIVVISFPDLVQASGTYELSDIQLGGSVQVIQEDLHAPGNLLISAGYALLTFDGTRSHLIAGMAHESGYVEGVRESVRFKDILGVLQLTKIKTLIVDSSNHCLRAVDRRTNRTHAYLGNCTNGGYSYGDKPMFYYPSGLLRDSKQSQIIYTLVSKRLIRINTGAMTSNVVIESDILQYYANLVQEPKSGDIYITTRLGVVKFDYTGYFLTLISGRSDSFYSITHRDGPLQGALFNRLKGIVVLGNGVLVVADRDNHRLRVLDSISDSTWSICSGQLGENEGDFDSCQLDYPFGIFADCETIYIGLENNRIGVIRITDIMSLTSQANSSNAPCTATDIQFAPTRNADLLTTETTSTEKAVTSAVIAGDCDFEEGLCSWTQSTADTFDWNLRSGATLSYDTGPATDHTTKTELGQYLYIDATGQSDGDTARIESLWFGAGDDMVISFYYHMYGRDIKTLTLYIITTGYGNDRVAWSLSGDQGNEWRQAAVDIVSSTPYQLVFEAVRGGSFYGDIAIDDIMITRTDGAAGTPGQSDREEQYDSSDSAKATVDVTVVAIATSAAVVIVLIIVGCVLIICFKSSNSVEPQD